uniref:Permease n=1 Tax=Solibacter usitatus (strain Ellin6076) TaxID=234267 RepID=Q024H6_SOLUE
MRLYRALLHLYPAGFRAEYAEDLCALFAVRRSQISNPLVLLALWLEAIADTVTSAIPVHLDILRQDLGWAARSLRRTPAFTATAILVAALGIGATTAAFTLTDHVLLRPLPFAHPDRLVKVWEDHSPRGYSRQEPSPANFHDWQRLATSFEAMGAYSSLASNLSGPGISDPEQLEGAGITGDLFALLGARPAIGRLITTADDRPESPRVIVLSDGLWRRRFGADPAILGRTIVLSQFAYTIIGVMPPGFYFPVRTAEFWRPLRFAAADDADRANNYLRVVARLRPGVTFDGAQAEMRLVAAQLERAWPKDNHNVGAAVTTLRDEVSNGSRLLLIALLAAAACVLLIGCTNLANLLLARALSRRRELAVRTAIGAGRERIVRQLLTESLLLSFAGGIAGVLVALASLPLLARLVPTSLPISETPVIDARVLAFAALLTAATGIAFGVLPALRACGGAAFHGLREGSRGGVGGRRERLRSTLVVAEVAGSIVLLVGCGLLLRALWRVQDINPGFRSAGVLTLRTILPFPRYNKVSDRERYYARVLSESRRLPGVQSAAIVSFIPMSPHGGIWPVSVPGRDPDLKSREAVLRFVTPGYFATLGIPLLSGRDVDSTDTQSAPFTAVVSESFARRYWPGENPLGRHFQFAYADRTIVGVVGDIRWRGLERVNSEPQVYLPHRQVPDGDLPWFAPKDLVLRVSAEPAVLIPALRQIVAAVDSQQPVSNAGMLTDMIESQTAPRAVQVRVLGAFAAIAFLLAAIGIHGLLSFTVSSRTQEFGVRLALGAQRTNILAMILRESAALGIAGIAIGVPLALYAAGAMRALLADVTVSDFPTYAAAITLCLLMTLASSLLPAIRALRVDPAAAIRVE